MLPELNTVAATLALFVSLGLLVIHYRNQVERRHGEIVQLRAQIISTLSAQQQRSASLLITGELVRLELRRLPDSDDKYQSIERLPRLLQSAAELKSSTDKGLKQFEEMETHRANRSAILLRLQRTAADLQKVGTNVQHAEEEMLSLLSDIRKQAEV